MTLIASSLTEIPIGGPNGIQACLKVTPPRSGYIVADRWQAIVNNPDAKGPGAYANGFRGKPSHYLCMDPSPNPYPAAMSNITLADPNYITIHNNGVFPLALFSAYHVVKGQPFYAVWSNPDNDPTNNWISLDFLKGDPSQCPDIQFQYRWLDGTTLTPWGVNQPDGTPIQIVPSPVNFYYHDGYVFGYNGVEVVNGAVVDGPQYGFTAQVG